MPKHHFRVKARSANNATVPIESNHILLPPLRENNNAMTEPYAGMLTNPDTQLGILGIWGDGETLYGMS